MPARTPERKAVRALALWVAMLAGTAHVAAQNPAPVRLPADAGSEPIVKSALTAPLFYQLLVGELELRQGAAGTAYDVLLDAARKLKDEQLFRRATDIALQARDGDRALISTRAWREAVPDSIEAHRYLVQILVALNRVPEAAEPLRSLLQRVPVAERPGFIAALPRFFARATDTRASAGVVEDVLSGAMQADATRTVATVAAGRAWLAAADKAKALQLAQRAAKADPQSDAPALLALEMLAVEPAAEAIVTERLRAAPDADLLRTMYARVLATQQRYPEALTQFERLTEREPTEPAPWLSLGALRMELKEPRAATQALEKYLQLVQARAPAPTPASSAPSPQPAPATADGDLDDSDAPAARAEALVQARLLLAQAAEQQGDIAGAERWLAQIDDPQRALAVQSRRASLLVRQGKLDEARQLIRGMPEKTPQDGRAKLLVEVQLLRDAKRWDEAYALLAQAAERYPGDADLLYEQAMMAEKMNRLDDMERLLRQVIEIKPDHQHAYNALGYSLADRGQRLPEARSLIRKALDMSPGEPFITDSLGWVEYRLGNREEALRLLRQAYRSRPDVEIAAHLGEVLWVNGERDEARRILRDARSRDGDNDVLREMLERLRVDL